MSDRIHRKMIKICNELKRLWDEDPVKFINKSFSFKGLDFDRLTPQQEDIIHNFIKYRKLCVSAGGGIGKSALAAMLIICHLCTHILVRIPTTAPSSKLLRDVLWSEIQSWLRRFKYHALFELTRDKLYIKGCSDWYAVARTVPKNANAQTLSSTLAGFHSSNLFVVVDEASGVPDPVYTAVEGACTKSDAYILLISNPVSTGGYYFDTIMDPTGRGASYKVLFYDARSSPLVDTEFEQNIITRYGKDHPMYTAKVLGQPISILSSVVVSPAVYDRTIKNNRVFQTGTIVLGVDVGGQRDLTVICHRCGDSFPEWGEYGTSSEPDIVREIVNLWEHKYKRTNDFYAVIDALGKGSGVYSSLLEKGLFHVIGHKGSEKSNTPTMFKHKRAEGFFRLHKAFPNLQFPVDPPERLKKELANLKFDFSKGPIAMEEKKKFVSRLGFSPDYSDAMMMTGAVAVEIISQFAKYTPGPAIMTVRNDTQISKYGKFSKFLQ